MNKVILITGGGKGLGRALVERFAACDDAIVYFTYNSSVEAALEIESLLKNTFAIHCDQRVEEQIKCCIEKIDLEQGKIDVLINNACPFFKPAGFSNTNWSMFQELLETNVKGTFLFMREAMELMKRNQRGKIINVLSSYVFSMPPEKLSHYVTAKYALMGLSKAAAAELVKYGITVNMLSPGLMYTSLTAHLPKKYLEVCAARHPMKRITTVEDTANVAAFLASEASDFLNGINVPVTGGEVF